MSNFSPVIAIQFSEIIHLPSCENKLQHTAARAKDTDKLIVRIFRVFNISAIFQFSEDVALSAQDMLHTEICTCESNAIIS